MARVVRISLRDVPELDDDLETPRPPPYPPPPTVLQQDRIADEVQRILARRSERKYEENFIRRVSGGGDLRTPASAAPTTPPHRDNARLGSTSKVSSFSSRAVDSADYGSKDSVELKAARLWNDIVQSAEKRR